MMKLCLFRREHDRYNSYGVYMAMNIETRDIRDYFSGYHLEDVLINKDIEMYSTTYVE